MIQILFQIFDNGRIYRFLIFLFELLPVPIDIIIRHIQRIHNVKLVRTIKDRCCDLEAKCFCCQRKVGLQDLSDIHTAWHTQRIQHDIQRTSVRQERHILYRKYAGYDTLVSVTSGHLIAD